MKIQLSPHCDPLPLHLHRLQLDDSGIQDHLSHITHRIRNNKIIIQGYLRSRLAFQTVSAQILFFQFQHKKAPTFLSISETLYRKSM